MATAQFEDEGPQKKIRSLSAANHALEIEAADGTTVMDVGRGNQPVRINSRSFSNATGSAIGLQVKPAQNVATTGDVIGEEISPRVNSGITVGGSVIGAHVDAYLKGTAAGTVTGDVRGQQIELVTDDAGTRTISGDVIGLRMRAAFSATTITGDMKAIEIEKAETQTNSKQWEAVLSLTDTVAGVWNSDPATEVDTSAAKGYMKVLVNGAVRYIALYDVAPID